MLKVLITVDGSERSLRAIDAVAKWSKATGPVEVLLVNVGERPSYYGEFPPYDVESVDARLQTAQDALLESAEKHARAAGRGVRGVPLTRGGCGAVVGPPPPPLSLGKMADVAIKAAARVPAPVRGLLPFRARPRAHAGGRGFVARARGGRGGHGAGVLRAHGHDRTRRRLPAAH